VALSQTHHSEAVALTALPRATDPGLDAEITELDEQLDDLVARATPRNPAAWHRDRVRRTAARHRSQNIERTSQRAGDRRALRLQPDPRVIGTTIRHRLNYGGDRDAIRSLHMIAVSRLR